MNNKVRVIVDIRGFMIRSWHSGNDPDATTDPETGKELNSARWAVDNFVEDYLANWYEEYPGAEFIFVMEGGNSFRKAIAEDYKFHSTSSSEMASSELNKVEKYITKTLHRMGFSLCRQEGAEGDDLIAYLCQNLDGSKIVLTVDQDLIALVDGPTSVVYYRQKGGPETLVGGMLELDIDHKYITLKKSLVGDPSDNIKGIPGFGIKAWEALVDSIGAQGLGELQKYVSRDYYEDLDKDAKSLGCKYLERIFLYKKEWHKAWVLARLMPELCNAIRNRTMYKVEWIKGMPVADTYTAMLAHYEGNEDVETMLEELKPEYILVTADNYAEQAPKFVGLMTDSQFIAWDYETYDPVKHQPFNEVSTSTEDFLDVLSSKITGCSIAVGRANAKVFYFSVDHADTHNIGLDQFKGVLEMCIGSGIPMVAHNVGFEAAITKVQLDLDLPKRCYLDTQLFAAHLFEEDRVGLKVLSKKHLEYSQSTYEETRGDRADMSELTGVEVLGYGCDDSLVTAQLFRLFSVLTELEHTNKFITEYECPSVAPIVDSYITGFMLDLDKLTQLREEDNESKEKNINRAYELLHDNNDKLDTGVGAATLYKDLAEFKRASLQLQNKNDEAIERSLQSLREGIFNGCKYRELGEFREKVEFIPTSAKINKVLKLIGLEEVQIKSMSNVSLMELILKFEELGESGNFPAALQSAIQRGVIKKREGAAYDDLVDVGSKILTADSKPVIVGEHIVPNSAKVMQMLLYGMLGLPIRRRSKVTAGSTRHTLGMHGSPATSEDAIRFAIAEDLQDAENSWKVEMLGCILESTSCATRESLYWSKYPSWVHPSDGRIHHHIKQAATVTHRPTGNSPNLLQVPKRDGGRTRSTIKCYDDQVFVSIDFSGQELRIQASECMDDNMLEAYIGDNKKEIHSITGAEIGVPVIKRTMPGVNLEDYKLNGREIDYEFFVEMLNSTEFPEKAKVVKELRTMAKTVNFLTIYIGGVETLAMELGVPMSVAEEIKDRIIRRYPGIARWQGETVKSAKERGFVTTAYGSRRHVWPKIVSNNGYEKNRAERQACNSRIQGCGADILKIVMTKAWFGGVFENNEATLLAPVYDEIAAVVGIDHVVSYINMMTEIMSITPPGHAVAMVPEVSISLDNWGDMKEFGASPSKEEIEEFIRAKKERLEDSKQNEEEAA